MKQSDRFILYETKDSFIIFDKQQNKDIVEITCTQFYTNSISKINHGINGVETLLQELDILRDKLRAHEKINCNSVETNQEGLLNCPFCGAIAEVVHASHIRCLNTGNCNAETRLGERAWNRRTILKRADTISNKEETGGDWSHG